VTTARAYAEVERLTRRRARNFAYGIMLLPRPKRQAISAIYAFARAVDDVADETKLTLNGLLRSGVARFTYTYDLGDNWEHQVLIERTQPALDAGRYPACVAGRRNCPPEDCGGPWGYAELLAAIADPAHPEHADQRAWLGEDFDPDEFDVDAADADLANRFGRK
jgi:hypothetical protein